MDDRGIDELQRIWELKEKGAISEEEYSRLKSSILEQTNESAESAPSKPLPAAMPLSAKNGHGPSYRQTAGIGCLVVLALFAIIAFIGSNGSPNNSVTNANNNGSSNPTGTPEASDQSSSEPSATWSYSQDEDKVRGGTTYYASTTSTNSIAQSFPYDSNTTMNMTVRKSPAYGTDVILTVSSGQMMCPSYEGCGGTVRFDNGPAEHIRFNGPEDESSESIFVTGAKQFITKLKSAKKVTIEKTLYQAGSPQFEFDVHGLKWNR